MPTQHPITTMQGLHEQRQAARSLWVGLHPQTLDSKWGEVDDPHVTVLFLGKGRSEEMADKLAERLAAMRVALPLQLQVDGAARFRTRSADEGDPMVLLLGPPHPLRRLRSELTLGLENVPTHDPLWHLTLRRTSTTEPVVLLPFDQRRVEMARLSLTCGDARVWFDSLKP